MGGENGRKVNWGLAAVFSLWEFAHSELDLEVKICDCPKRISWGKKKTEKILEFL